MTVFDTNIIIDFLNGEKAAEDIVKNTTDNRGVKLTMVSCYELLSGASKSQEERLGAFLDSIIIYPLDMNSARIASEFYRESRKRGNELGIADILILATAKANDEIFVTQDRAFEGMYGKVIVISRKR